jgi:iron complex outermembrane recepter protein
MNWNPFPSRAVLAALALITVTTARAEDPGPQPDAASNSPPAPPPARQDPQPAFLPGDAVTLSAAELEQRRITSLAGIASAIPSVSMTPSLSSSSAPMLYMRGIGLDNPTQITRDAAVGVYEDGFYIARQDALTFDVPGLDHIEVREGPQGASSGYASIAGAVNLVSRPPSGELRLEQTADVGNRNLFRVVSSVDAPRWYGLAAKLTVIASSIDGDVNNPFPGAHNYGEERQLGARMQLRWDLLSSLRADYFLEKSDLNSTPNYDTNPYLNGQTIFDPFIDPFDFSYYANPSRPLTTTYRPISLPLSTSNHIAQGLTLMWQPTAALAVKSLTGYRTLGEDGKQDYADIFDLGEATEDFYHHHQFSEELQLLGSWPQEQLSYTAGLFYLRERGYHDRSYFLYGILSQETGLPLSILNQVTATARSEAAYVQLHWQPWSRFQIGAAARYTEDVKDATRSIENSFNGVQESGSVSHLIYKRVEPAVTLSYRWTPGVESYASFLTGYRPGAALESAAVGSFSRTFRPESVATYELGLRSSFLDERMHANLAVFDSRYRDIQYAMPLSYLEDEVETLQQASIQGAELNVSVTPVQDLTVALSGAFLHWRIDKALVEAGTQFDPGTASVSPYVVGQNIREVFSLPYAPKYNFTASTDYAFLHLLRTDVSAHLDYGYRGTMSSDAGAGLAVPGHQFDAVPAVGLLNARLTLLQETDRDHHVKVSLWGQNVLNRKYYALAGGYSSAFATTSNGTTTIPAGYLGRLGAWAGPATYGLYASYEY